MKPRLKIDKTMRKMFNKFRDEMFDLALKAEESKNYCHNYPNTSGCGPKISIEYYDAKMREKWSSLIDQNTYDIWIEDTAYHANLHVGDIVCLSYSQKRYRENRGLS